MRGWWLANGSQTQASAIPRPTVSASRTAGSSSPYLASGATPRASRVLLKKAEPLLPAHVENFAVGQSEAAQPVDVLLRDRRRVLRHLVGQVELQPRGIRLRAARERQREVRGIAESLLIGRVYRRDRTRCLRFVDRFSSFEAPMRSFVPGQASPRCAECRQQASGSEPGDLDRDRPQLLRMGGPGVDRPRFVLAIRAAIQPLAAPAAVVGAEVVEDPRCAGVDDAP